MVCDQASTSFTHPESRLQRDLDSAVVSEETITPHSADCEKYASAMIQVDEICERGRDGPPPRRLFVVSVLGGKEEVEVEGGGLAESASADSQKPSDVEGGDGGGGGCAKSRQRPPAPSAYALCRRFAKRPPSAALCLK